MGLRLQLAVVCIVIQSKLKGPIMGLRLQLAVAQKPRPRSPFTRPAMCHWQWKRPVIQT
jgi:hypothetical protein